MFLEVFPKFLGHKLYVKYLDKRNHEQNERQQKAEMNGTTLSPLILVAIKQSVKIEELLDEEAEQMLESFQTTFGLPREETLVSYSACSMWQNVLRKGGLCIPTNQNHTDHF